MRAVAAQVPGRHELALEHLGAEAAGVPPGADDLPVATRGVERRAGLAYTSPPCRQWAIATVVKAS